MRALTLLLLAVALRADDQTNKMTARLAEEAAAFVKIAPEVIATERLQQRVIKPPSRFHPRIGTAATAKPQVEWKEHQVVSEYAFSQFGGSEGAIHELRQVTSVDGKKVAEENKAQAALAAAMTAKDDAQKRAMLKEFEKFGLNSAVTDFGQLLLLFSGRDVQRYEFTYRPPKMIGYDRATVWAYKQLDGPETLTLFEPSKSVHLKIEGEVRVRTTDLLPLQITLVTQQGDAPNSVREEAAVTYKMTPFGVLMPSATEHRELRGGKVVMENHFTYADFHKFGASSDITFPK